MCVSLAAGATFALFTSQSKVNITVSSGKVQVLAEITDFNVYSPTLISQAEGNPIVDAENAATEVTQDGTVYSGIFYNKGTATLNTTEDAGAITLTNMTPGDKVTFTLTLKNESNVKVKYRTTVAHGENSATDLLKALVFNIGGITVESSTIWKSLDPADSDDDKNIAVYECSIELPTSVNNDYQDKSCEIYFLVEAIQGNAETVDATAKIATMASVAVSSINTETQTEQTAEGEKTYLVTKTSLDITSKDSVPASDTQTVAVAKAVIPEGAKLEETATQLTLNIYETETPSNFKVEDGKNAKALEVEMKGLSSDNTAPIKVTMFVGKNLENLTLTHITADGTKTKMTSVTELDKVVKDKFYYDSTTGLVTMATATFSPFVCSFDAKLVSTAEEFIEALKDASLKTIKLNADITIDPTKYNVDNRLYVETEGLTIDLNKKTLTAANCTLTITGDNVTIKNGKMVASNNGSYTMMIKGKNVTVDDITMTGGVNVCGKNTDNPDNPDATATITDCKITGTGFYTVCTQYNTVVTVKNSTLKCEKGANGCFFWAAKTGHKEGEENKVDSKIYCEDITFYGEGKLYNEQGVAPIIVANVSDRTTLEAALNNEKVSVVKLTQNISNPEGKTSDIYVYRDVTIDFNGHVLGIALQSGSTSVGDPTNNLTLIDSANSTTGGVKSKLVSLDGGGSQQIVAVTAWKYTITIDGGYYTHNSQVLLCQLQTENPDAIGMVINGGTFDGQGAASVIANVIGNVVVNGGTFNAHYDSEYTGECVYLSCGDSDIPTITTINGGTFNADKRIFYVDVNSSYIQKINVTGGTFNLADGENLIEVSSGDAKDYLVITGGTFNVNPSAYLAEGYEVKTETDSDGATWYKVVAKSANEG